METTKEKPLPSLSTVRNYWHLTIALLTFRHRDLFTNYGKFDVARITAHLQILVKEKKIWKGRFYDRAWLGMSMLRRIADTWLKDGLKHGVSSWDRRLLKLLTPIMMSAVTSRVGDVLRSSSYTRDEYVKWQDIQLTLPPGGELCVQNFRCRISLRYLKGYK
jgi:hypothetical protein